MDDVAGCADSVRNGAAVLPVAGVEELAGTADIIGAAETDGIIPVVPPIAESGLGPLSGDVTIVPGVDARPIAVVPMVETCARAALQPASRTAVVNSKRRIAIPSFVKI